MPSSRRFGNAKVAADTASTSSLPPTRSVSDSPSPSSPITVPNTAKRPGEASSRPASLGPLSV
ncbi:MAG: hypothetical protein H6730_34180 [Deltaproteobacteria bacterium]|nr:hypothetical protein [Deltaproteobacteria bacterium]